MIAVTHFLCFAEMGVNRASDPAAGPLSGNFSLHSRVEGQDGALQYKRAKTGKRENSVSCSNCILRDAKYWTRIVFSPYLLRIIREKLNSLKKAVTAHP